MNLIACPVRLPEDADGFVRRECPACDRTFKTRPLPSDAFAVHAFLCNQHSQANEEELHAEVGPLTCLYCGHSAPAHVWLTEDQQEFLRDLAEQLGALVRYEQLAFVERTLRQNPRPTYVPVPPHPLITEMEAEPDDGAATALVCCGAEVKGALKGRDGAFCPACGIAHRERPAKPEPLPAASA